MQYHDPDRPRVGDRPSWLLAPTLALPDIVIDVSEELHKFDCRLMLARTDYSGRWVERKALALTEVAKLLVDWHDDPELCVVRWFEAEAPDQAKMERRAKSLPVEKILVPAGDVNIADLGL